MSRSIRRRSASAADTSRAARRPQLGVGAAQVVQGGLQRGVQRPVVQHDAEPAHDLAQRPFLGRAEPLGLPRPLDHQQRQQLRRRTPPGATRTCASPRPSSSSGTQSRSQASPATPLRCSASASAGPSRGTGCGPVRQREQPAQPGARRGSTPRRSPAPRCRAAPRPAAAAAPRPGMLAGGPVAERLEHRLGRRRRPIGRTPGRRPSGRPAAVRRRAPPRQRRPSAAGSRSFSSPAGSRPSTRTSVPRNERSTAGQRGATAAAATSTWAASRRAPRRPGRAPRRPAGRPPRRSAARPASPRRTAASSPTETATTASSHQRGGREQLGRCRVTVRRWLTRRPRRRAGARCAAPRRRRRGCG